MSRLVMRLRTVQLLLLWGTSASASAVVAYESGLTKCRFDSELHQQRCKFVFEKCVIKR